MFYPYPRATNKQIYRLIVVNTNNISGSRYEEGTKDGTKQILGLRSNVVSFQKSVPQDAYMYGYAYTYKNISTDDNQSRVQESLRITRDDTSKAYVARTLYTKALDTHSLYDR